MKVEVQNKKEEIIKLNVGDIVKIEYSHIGINYYIVAENVMNNTGKCKLRNLDGELWTAIEGTPSEILDHLQNYGSHERFTIYPKDKFKLVLQEF